jgi:hypothetical protein
MGERRYSSTIIDLGTGWRLTYAIVLKCLKAPKSRTAAKYKFCYGVRKSEINSNKRVY